MLTYDFELNKQQLLYQTIDRASHGLLCNLLDWNGKEELVISQLNIILITML